MKKCSKCKKKKRLSSFRWSNRRLGYYRAECKSCSPDASMSWRSRTPEWKAEHNRRSVEEQRVRAERNIEWIASYLHEHPCTKCGESDIVVLEFHHRNPKEKRGRVSMMAGTGKSLDVIQKEIEKCNVLCANCHRIETAHQLSFRILKYRFKSAKSVSGSIGDSYSLGEGSSPS